LLTERRGAAFGRVGEADAKLNKWSDFRRSRRGDRQVDRADWRYLRLSQLTVGVWFRGTSVWVGCIAGRPNGRPYSSQKVASKTAFATASPARSYTSLG